jgi:hypothetical protein
VVRELGVQGAEADVLLVRDASGQEFVVKVYRSGITVDAEVRDRLARLDTTHLVAVVETGASASGRLFEVLEYAAAGTLRSLVDERHHLEDWWALGMIARELATARCPFAGLSEPVVLDHRQPARSLSTRSPTSASGCSAGGC